MTASAIFTLKFRTLASLVVAATVALTATQALAATPPSAKAKAEARMNAVNRALEQSLTERAKRESDFEKNASAGRPRESVLKQRLDKNQKAAWASSERAVEREVRTMDARHSDQREEMRRERRLNWLND
jgi:hypothetical protein